MLFLKHHKGFPDARVPPACTSGKAFLMLPLNHWNFLTARMVGTVLGVKWLEPGWLVEESGNGMGENAMGQTCLSL